MISRQKELRDLENHTLAPKAFAGHWREVVTHILLARANVASTLQWIVLKDNLVCCDRRPLSDLFLLPGHHTSGRRLHWLFRAQREDSTHGWLSHVSLELVLGILCLSLLSQLCVPVAPVELPLSHHCAFYSDVTMVTEVQHWHLRELRSVTQEWHVGEGGQLCRVLQLPLVASGEGTTEVLKFIFSFVFFFDFFF